MQSALHLAALCAFAFAQPLYDLPGQNPTYFVARGAQPSDVWLFVLGLSLAVPLLVAIPVWLAQRLAPRAGAALTFAAQTLLAACVALPLVNALTGLPGLLACGVALALGGAFAFALLRMAALRTFTSLAAAAVLIFPALFVFTTPAGGLLRGGESGAAGGADARGQVPVLFVIFDGMPLATLLNERRAIDAEAFPHFARLAADATWYRNTTTAAIDTNHAVPALLTGRTPAAGAAPNAAQYPENLFTWLGGAYRISALEHVTRLCPAELCERTELPLAERMRELLADTSVVVLHVLAPADWARALPSIQTDWRGFAGARDWRGSPGERTPARDVGGMARVPTRESVDDRMHEARRHGDAFAANATGDDRLFYLHARLPHGPHTRLPSGRRYVRPGREAHAVVPGAERGTPLSHRLGTTGGRLRRRWGDDDAIIALAVQRHLLQVGAADRILGELLDRWQQSGVYERALLVVTSDHGESYRAGGLERDPLDGNTVHVPLFVKQPGQTRGTVDELSAQLVDVLPTLADALGRELPWEVDGRSLLGAAHTAEPAQRRVLAGTELHEVPEGQLAAALARIDALVGIDRSPQAVSAEKLARNGIALGDPAAGWLADGRLIPLQAKVQQAAELAAVDPESGFVPAYLTGRIEGAGALLGGAGEPFDVALALNGALQAAGRSYTSESGELGFALMLPEAAFRAGANQATLYRIQAGEPTKP